MLFLLRRLVFAPALFVIVSAPLESAAGQAAEAGGTAPPDVGDLVPEGWTFTDVTGPEGLAMETTFGDDAFSFILEDTGSGVAVLDADGDGKLDVYVLNGGWVEGVNDPAFRERYAGAVNRLFRNRGDGTFEDITEAAGVGEPGYGMGAVVGDFDGDGDDDLHVLNWGPDVLYRNEGDGTFVDVTEAAGVAGPETSNGFPTWSVNGLFLDHDRDGDLDLYVACYLAFDPDFVDPELPEEYPYPGPESYRGQASRLYRNDGDGTFTDVTEAAGLLREDGKTMGASAGDLDGDGWPDLFEAVDFTGNLLFRNRGDGTFVELAGEAGVAFDAAGRSMASMHGSIGDADGDGDLDVFVPDLENGCLYRNDGEFRFREVSASAGLAATLAKRGGWGSRFADFDLDGDLDLLVVLGGAFDLAAGERDRLFLNDGHGKFTDVSERLGGYFEQKAVSRGAAFADFDDDGDLDLVVSRKDVGLGPQLVRNDLPPGRHWLALRLRGTRSNRDGIGARVELTASGRTQVREAFRSGSYLSSDDPRVHFGLGGTDRVERLVVRWPSGTVQEVTVEAVDRILLVEEPRSAGH